MRRIVPTVAFASALAITALVLFGVSYLSQSATIWFASLSDREMAVFRSVCAIVTAVSIGIVVAVQRRRQADDHEL